MEVYIMEEQKKKRPTYAELSEKARQKNIDSATRYNREKAVRISLKTTQENFTDIDNYMNECITQGKSKSKNGFLLEAIRYAIAKDFKGIRD